MIFSFDARLKEVDSFSFKITDPLPRDELPLIQVYRKFTTTCLYSRFSLYSAY